MSVGNQQFDAAAIESIVREVLRRVQELRRRSGLGTPTSTHAPSATTNSAPAHVFECSNKVISMETLRGKLDNITTLRVTPKAIVTPAVRDELSGRKITITRDLGSSHNQTNGSATILLGTTCNSTGNSLRDRLVAKGAQIQLHVDKCALQLARKVGDKVSTTMPALIVTDQPYKAACSANRNSNVRAVVVRDAQELTVAKAELNPNCVVLNSDNVARVNLTTILNQLT